MGVELRRAPRGARRRGFSLVEVLIAVVLLLMILVGLLPLFTQSVINNRAGSEASQISNFGRSQVEEFLQLDFNDARLQITSGDSNLTVEHFSRDEHRWLPGEDPATGDIASWIRRTTVRQYHVSALADKKLLPSEAQPSGALAEYIHLKQVTVELENNSHGNPVRPVQTMTINLFKAE